MTTMHEKYKDGSGHQVCEKCGLCKTCGDCAKYGCGEKSGFGLGYVEENMKTIFTLTVVGQGDKIRCIGWFQTLDEAQQALVHSDFISEDGYYRYCVIEEVAGGCLHPFPPEREQWYKLIGGEYRTVKKPQFRAKTVNFGIG